jgi:hypothetical protein
MIKLQLNNFVVTFDTEEEVVEYINRHIPEEKRLLWLGFMIGSNYVGNQVNQTFNLEYKNDSIK